MTGSVLRKDNKSFEMHSTGSHEEEACTRPQKVGAALQGEAQRAVWNEYVCNLNSTMMVSLIIQKWEFKEN